METESENIQNQNANKPKEEPDKYKIVRVDEEKCCFFCSGISSEESHYALSIYRIFDGGDSNRSKEVATFLFGAIGHMSTQGKWVFYQSQSFSWASRT